MWGWLDGLSNGAANFLGSLTGASIGLLAILIGALINAHLNRRRDDRLREADRSATASAIRAELSTVHRILTRNAEYFEKPDPEDFIGTDLDRAVRVLPHMLPRFGLLDPITIQATIAAYGLIEEHTGRILMMGGSIRTPTPDRRLIVIPRQSASAVATMNRNFAEKIDKAIGLLGQYDDSSIDTA